MSRRSKKILIAIAIFIVAVIVIFSILSHSIQSSVNPTNTKVIKLFSFNATGTDGKTYNQSNLIRKKTMIFFGYTYCPIVCPTTNYRMARLLKDLGRRAKNLNVYFVTVDPDRDSSVRLKKYLASFDPKIVGIVSNSSKNLVNLAKSFSVYYEKVKEGKSYSMNHTSTIFLVNKNGKLYTKIGYLESYKYSLRELKDFLDD